LHLLVEDVAKRIHCNDGAALFIDYGERFSQADTLRGFKEHTQKNILSEPGLIDLTTDVNFLECENTVIAKLNINI
jgi:SAM-dependent MidA family methyltransferase